ncbi:MAG: hypothetical protein AAB959_00375, partial [Patescibacteria group bacterium]
MKWFWQKKKIVGSDPPAPTSQEDENADIEAEIQAANQQARQLSGALSPLSEDIEDLVAETKRATLKGRALRKQIEVLDLTDQVKAKLAAQREANIQSAKKLAGEVVVEPQPPSDQPQLPNKPPTPPPANKRTAVCVDCGKTFSIDRPLEKGVSYHCGACVREKAAEAVVNAAKNPAANGPKTETTKVVGKCDNCGKEAADTTKVGDKSLSGMYGYPA